MTEHTLLCDDVPLAAIEQAIGTSFVTDEASGLVGAIVAGDDGSTAVEILVLEDNVWNDEDEQDEHVRSFRRSLILTGSQSPGVARRVFDVVALLSRAMLFRDFGTLIAEAAAPVAAE